MQWMTGEAVGRIIRGELCVRYVLQRGEAPHATMNGRIWRLGHKLTGQTVFALGQTHFVQSGAGKAATWWTPGDTFGTGVVHGRSTLQVRSKHVFTPPEGAGFPESAQPLQLVITGITPHDVRAISDAEASHAGFEGRMQFLSDWTGACDRFFKFLPRSAVFGLVEHPDADSDYPYILSVRGAGEQHGRMGKGPRWLLVSEAALITALQKRPARNYAAWRLAFEVVRD